jgi:hypothetical protein
MSSNLSKKRKKIKLHKENKQKTNDKETDFHKDKFEKVAQVINPITNYTKIKYKNEVYSVNDCLLIKDPLVKDGYLIARLLQILPTNGIEKYPYWPSIQVQWYILDLILGFIQKAT